jgi:capsular polysaccharide transport system permease protein
MMVDQTDQSTSVSSTGEARLRMTNAGFPSVLRQSFRLHSALRRRLGLLGYSFVVTVLLPAVAVLFYLAAFASEEFVSEARFAVRAASETSASPASDLMSMVSSFTGVRSTNQDAFIVIDYIRSRKIIDDLGGSRFVEGYYSGGDIDWISRLQIGETLEDIWDYWRSKVSAIIDTQSNILTLRVRAYSADDARAIAQKIVARGENLVNQISERSRRDAVERAEREVQAALQKLAAIRQALLEFRNRSSNIDPVASATSFAETMTKLMRDKIALENTRESARPQLDANSPIMRVLDTQIASLDTQIKSIQNRLTSQTPDSSTISGQLTDYEDLQLQSQFAEKLFSITQSVFEKARVEQDKQQLYLAMVVPPTLAEEASYPRPLTGSAITFALCLVIWSMFSLVIASIRDHIG